MNETAAVVRLLVQKGGSPMAIPTGVAPKTALTKRKRDAEPSLVFMRQLMCIPSISERIARLLLDHFGNLRELQDALEDLKSFPKSRLDDRTCIGKARLRILAARYLA